MGNGNRWEHAIGGVFGWFIRLWTSLIWYTRSYWHGEKDVNIIKWLGSLGKKKNIARTKRILRLPSCREVFVRSHGRILYKIDHTVYKYIWKRVISITIKSDMKMPIWGGGRTKQIHP
jgi:hypothetical protein